MKSFRLPLVLSTTLLAGAIASAQFGGLDLNKLKKGLDTAKDAGQIVKGVAGIGPEEERKIGEAVALEVIGRYGGLVRDEEIMRRVNLVGRALARYSDRPDLPWQFAVLDSDTLNAFSAPGGLVFITRGLYEQAASDDVLAGILGHEIAHITNKNALKIVQRGDLASGGKNLLLKRSNQAREINAQVAQVGSMLGFDVLGLVKKLVESGFDPKTEFTADKDGRELAVTTGYAPGGLRTVLFNLQQRGENRKAMFSTHPPLAERLSRLPDEPAPAEPAPDAEDKPAGEVK